MRGPFRSAAAAARSVMLGAALVLGGAPALAQGAAETHTLSFRNADIVAFIEDVGALTGYTFIVHPEVRGTVTVTSQAELTNEEVFEVFLATLRTYGYTAIPTTPGAYRIVPETTAAQNTGTVGQTDLLSSDEFVTEVFELRHISAEDAARVVTPLVNHRGQVSANPQNNMLVVVDYSGNIGRLREILADLDQDRTVVQTVTLMNASAYDVARLVTAIEGDPANGGTGAVGGPRAVAVALQGTNSVVLRGDPAGVARLRALVTDLDVAGAPTDNLRVITLQNARAAEIVPTLEAVARTLRPSTENPVTIPYDEATNSVILTADPQTLSMLSRVVEELDVRRPQVVIEAIIVEIGEGLSRDLGVQYLIAGDGVGSATNFSRSAPNLLAITGALTLDGDGDDDELTDNVRNAALASILGAQGGILGAGGQNDDGLFGVILNAVQNDDASNVLSTPHITTLDNETASILVGQEIPITTGEALGSDNLNPFRTIERQEVGVKLQVTPQISDGDTIKLTIVQEVSSVFDAVAGEFITNKRTIDTTVLADNGEIIVLGGLIEGTESAVDSKVPLLGDVPLLGRAFSSTSRERTRTNLVVFIRSTILRDADASRANAQQSLDDLLRTQTGRSGAAADRFDGLLRDALGQSYGGQQ